MSLMSNCLILSDFAWLHTKTFCTPTLNRGGSLRYIFMLCLCLSCDDISAKERCILNLKLWHQNLIPTKPWIFFLVLYSNGKWWCHAFMWTNQDFAIWFGHSFEDPLKQILKFLKYETFSEQDSSVFLKIIISLRQKILQNTYHLKWFVSLLWETTKVDPPTPP